MSQETEGAAMSEVTDEAIIYQLEKADQGGDVSDLLEDRVAVLAEAWGYEVEEDDEHYGLIKLPDGRYAGLRFEAFIYDPKEEIKASGSARSE